MRTCKRPGCAGVLEGAQRAYCSERCRGWGVSEKNRRYRQAHPDRAAHRAPVDEVAVERVVRNREPCRLNRNELRLAVRRLTDQGVSAQRIAELTFRSSRTITRYRSAA